MVANVPGTVRPAALPVDGIDAELFGSRSAAGKPRAVKLGDSCLSSFALGAIQRAAQLC